MRNNWSGRHAAVLLAALVVWASQSCMFEEEESPKERRIVLQLDVNPKKIDFKKAVVAGKEGLGDQGRTNEEQESPVQVEGRGSTGVKPVKPQRAGARPRQKRKPRLTMEGLLNRLEAVKLERTRRGYQPGELPAVDQAVSKAEKFLDENRLEDAAREITRAQRALDNFKIDRQYIERRLEILNRDPRVSRLSGATLQRVSKLLDGVNKAYLKGNYKKANAIIDKIRKIVSRQ